MSDKYFELKRVLADAELHASHGKGKVRHATDEAFEDQKICVITRWLEESPVAGPLFQAVKKCVESARMDEDRAIQELYGAINYIAAAILVLEEYQELGPEEISLPITPGTVELYGSSPYFDKIDIAGKVYDLTPGGLVMVPREDIDDDGAVSPLKVNLKPGGITYVTKAQLNAMIKNPCYTCDHSIWSGRDHLCNYDGDCIALEKPVGHNQERPLEGKSNPDGVLYPQHEAEELRGCGTCFFGHYDRAEMPCKKCFPLHFLPHWKYGGNYEVS